MPAVERHQTEGPWKAAGGGVVAAPSDATTPTSGSRVERAAASDVGAGSSIEFDWPEACAIDVRGLGDIHVAPKVDQWARISSTTWARSSSCACGDVIRRA